MNIFLTLVDIFLLWTGWDINIGDWIVFSPQGAGSIVTNDIMLQYYIINP